MKTCINCVYNVNCGDFSRVVPCDGRTTKTDIKNRIKAYKDAIKAGKLDAKKGNEITNILNGLIK